MVGAVHALDRQAELPVHVDAAAEIVVLDGAEEERPRWE